MNNKYKEFEKRLGKGGKYRDERVNVRNGIVAKGELKIHDSFTLYPFLTLPKLIAPTPRHFFHYLTSVDPLVLLGLSVSSQVILSTLASVLLSDLCNHFDYILPTPYFHLRNLSCTLLQFPLLF